MMDAPASNASRADRAIASGVTGTIGCWRGSVRTPFRAQVRIALSIAVSCLFNFADERPLSDLASFRDRQRFDNPRMRGGNADFHFHGFDDRELGAGRDVIAFAHTHLGDAARYRGADEAAAACFILLLPSGGFPEDKAFAIAAQMQRAVLEGGNRASAYALRQVSDFGKVSGQGEFVDVVIELQDGSPGGAWPVANGGLRSGALELGHQRHPGAVRKERRR